MSVESRLRAALTETVRQTAEEYAEDLAEFLFRNHRVTGLLADSIGTEEAGPDESVAGTDVPYADLFEAKTGAVARFVDGWAAGRGGEVAVRAGRRASGKLSE